MEGEAANTWIILSVVGAMVLLVGLVLLRTLTNAKAEVRLTDAAIALIPIIVALFVTGKITKLAVGPEGVSFEVKEAILGAARNTAADEIERIEPETIRTAAKGGRTRIPEYLARGVQALTFQTGGLYVPEIMREYFTELTRSPRFKYMVLIDDTGAFFGIMDARKLVALIEASSQDGPTRRSLDWAMLRDWIQSDPKKFHDLSGFIKAEEALKADASKSEALTRLQEERLEWLPVVDEQDRLAGVVERSRLTAGLILDVANRLQQ